MSDIRKVRSVMSDFKAYSAGLSIAEIRKKYNPGQVIKLASNENPLGTSPVVQRTIKNNAANAFRYARPATPELSTAIADSLGVSASRIVAGNGSDELIDLLIRVKARPGQDNILMFRPCFSMYPLQAKLNETEIRQVPLAQDFSFPFDKMLECADENTALCFITTPDNPSGYAPALADIKAFARALPKQCLLVIDEAYIEFARPCGDYSILPYLSEFENVAILRTFSKVYGLAGLRLGYTVAPEWLCEHLLKIKLPFSVNTLAEQAGLAALKDHDFLQKTLNTVAAGRQTLTDGLKKLHCKVYPSLANFLLFKLPDNSVSAQAFFTALLKKGIIIRSFTEPILAQYLRVTIGNKQENQIFLEKAADILKKGPPAA